MLQTTTFTAPSGIEYTIREQNGQDEEVLTNVAEAKKYMTINNFLQGIIEKTSKKEGKLTIQEVLDIPWLDRQCILFNSRVFSLGEILEFTYKWPKENGKGYTLFEYELDLNEYLFNYSKRDTITPEEIEAKPQAIPFYPVYPLPQNNLFIFELSSGKKIRFKLLDGNAELFLIRLPIEEQSRNTEMIARSLELQVDGKWERVQNFSLFSVKDMRELRKHIAQVDPSFAPETEVANPSTEESLTINIHSIPDFFFPGEGV